MIVQVPTPGMIPLMSTRPAPVRCVEEADGRWLRVVLDAPRGNLLSLDMVTAIDRVLDARAGRPSLRWLTFEGAGGEFSFGAALQEHLPATMPTVFPVTHALLLRLLDLPVPTAALVDGRCLGGGFELALCCDEILATGAAVFGLPEIRVGAFPPVGALLLPLKVGAARAAGSILAGDLREASSWQAAGLVTVVEPGRPLLDAARAWFDARLAPHSAVALSHAARASRAVIRRQVAEALPASSADPRRVARHPRCDGRRARLAHKRPPRWEDR